MLFDTHAHYDDERFDEDRDTLLASMPENNVGLILNPGCDVESSRKAVSYANRYPFVYAAVGLHPENIEAGWTDALAEIRRLAKSEPRVRAIGEIGLDYYWEKDERARTRQQVVFARQMELARELKMPVIVHDRDAHADCLEITRRYPDVTGVYHCYAGHVEMARELLERGYYLSFTGVITFKNAKKVHESAKAVASDRILTETHCPYLTPEPFRGVFPNEPKNVNHTLANLALLREEKEEELERQILENAERLFFRLKTKK